MSLINTLRLNDKEFAYKTADFDAVTKESNGAITNTRYILIQFDTTDEEQREYYNQLKVFPRKQSIPVSVNYENITGYIENIEGDAPNIIRLRLH